MNTIVIADDEPSLRRLMAATLAGDQYAIVQAADGDEAWRLIQEHRPAVALLDVQMPGRTGLDLLRAIRNTPGLAALPVILISGKAQQADAEAGVAAGADYYLFKPFSPLVLLELIERAVRGLTIERLTIDDLGDTRNAERGIRN